MSIKRVIENSNSYALDQIERDTELTDDQRAKYERTRQEARKRFGRIILDNDPYSSPWDSGPPQLYLMTFKPVVTHNTVVVLERVDDTEGRRRLIAVEPEMLAPEDYDPYTLEGAVSLKLTTRAKLRLPEEAAAGERLAPSYHDLGEQMLSLGQPNKPLTLTDSRNADAFVTSLTEVEAAVRLARAPL
jgi:hypothetical protein